MTDSIGFKPQDTIDGSQVDSRLQTTAILTQVAKRAIQGDVACLNWLEDKGLLSLCVFNDGTKAFEWNHHLHDVWLDRWTPTGAGRPWEPLPNNCARRESFPCNPLRRTLAGW